MLAPVKSDRLPRPDCSKANLARDGPSLQGPRELLTTILREFALFADHLFATLRPQYPNYTLNVDYDTLFKTVSMRPEAGNKEGNGKEPAVIGPIPWENAPAADGNTAVFKRRLKECREFMHHFSMHTPHCFIEHQLNSNRVEGSGGGGGSLTAHEASKAAAVPKKATSGKNKGSTVRNLRETANHGSWSRGKKRKAPGGNVKEGLSSGWNPVVLNADLS